jgi:hypothetical protein
VVVDRVASLVTLFIDGKRIGDWKSDALAKLRWEKRHFGFYCEVEANSAPSRRPKQPRVLLYVSRFRMEPCLPPKEAAPESRDRVLLHNGDCLKGTLGRVAPGGWEMDTDVGPVSLGWGKVESVFFAGGATFPQEDPAKPWTRFRLGARGVLTASAWRHEGGFLVLESPWTGGSLRVPEEMVTGLWVPRLPLEKKKKAKAPEGEEAGF